MSSSSSATEELDTDNAHMSTLSSFAVGMQSVMG